MQIAQPFATRIRVIKVILTYWKYKLSLKFDFVFEYKRYCYEYYYEQY